MEIVPSIVIRNPCYKAGKKIAVKGLMLHSVGCSQPSAKVLIDKWNNTAKKDVCVHAFIDGNTGAVYQTLPWDYRGWHAGKGDKGSANDTHIGVEMCEPDDTAIRYLVGASFECLNRDAAMAVVKRTYDTAVELFAFLCWKFGLDPLQDGVIISHKEGHDRRIASGHVDPTHLWDGLRSGYTMDGFRQDVNQFLHRAKLKGDSEWADLPQPEEPPQAQLPQQEEPLQAQLPQQEEPPRVQPPQPGESRQQQIRPGDIVKIMPGAVYYAGDAIPDWVRIMEWYVKSVSGDRVVLGRNTAGTKNINSPVEAKYLIVTAENLDEPLEAPVRDRMAISEEGIEFIMRFEGCRLEAYQCAAEVWTIGYGHTRDVKAGDRLPSEEEAKRLLREDLEEYTGYVNTYIENGVIAFAPNQNQFDALTSFCFNRGSGALRELAAGRDAEAVAQGMCSYILVKGEVNEGLKRRREEERELFLR